MKKQELVPKSKLFLKLPMETVSSMFLKQVEADKRDCWEIRQGRLAFVLDSQLRSRLFLLFYRHSECATSILTLY